MTSPVELLRVGPLNAAAAILGTTTLVTMTTLGFAILPAAITCVVITFVARVVGVAFGLRIPEQRRLEHFPLPTRLSRSYDSDAEPA
jgi:uncharacterized membrane protein YeiH